MKATFPYDRNDVKTWAQSARSLPHALISAEHAESLHVGFEPSGRLLEQVGAYLLRRAKFASAKSVLGRALKIDEAVYGPDHSNVARDVSNLGEVLKQQGDLAGARAHYERALRIDDAVYGSNHPNVASDVAYLGDVLREQGDVSGARVHFERALKIYESTYGLDHPGVARVVTNLGDVLLEQGAGALRAGAEDR
jgi:tetratricopeptide (TPR) repeat protein